MMDTIVVLSRGYRKLSLRPDVLKNCLQRSVEKGYLEQITGKGASGTFQVSYPSESLDIYNKQV